MQNELADYNSNNIRTTFQNNTEYASFKDICRACILNATSELKKLQAATFAVNKIKIQHPEIWIETSIVSAWLKMAEIIVNTEEYDIAQSIINRFDKTEKQFSLPDISTIDGQIQMVKMYALQLEEKKRTDAALAIAGPKAEKYDQIVIKAKEGIGVAAFYRRFAFKYFVTEKDFCKFVDEELGWGWIAKGSKTRKAKIDAVRKGYVIDGISINHDTGQQFQQFPILPLGEEVLIKEIEKRFDQKKIG